MKAALNYLSDVKIELGKVTWPKKNEVIKLTLIIFIISGAVALFLGTLDLGLTKLFETIIIK